MTTDEKIEKAMDIIHKIHQLPHFHKDGYEPKGYGNSEINKAKAVMHEYIKIAKTLNQ